MKGDGLANLGLDLRDGGAGGDTAGQIRNVSRLVALGLFNHDRVAHVDSLFPTSLLQDAVEGARRQVIAWPARDRDATGFRRVLAATRAYRSGRNTPSCARRCSFCRLCTRTMFRLDTDTTPAALSCLRIRDRVSARMPRRPGSGEIDPFPTFVS